MESALRQGGRDPSLKLIETLAWDGTQAVRAARHLARLARSAALLGWDCDPAAAEAALLQGRAGPARLRLTLDRAGRIEVTAGAIIPFA
ncbi:MAG: aminotransferase class IV, partial [Rhodobacter sp.]|nr:aminotransferase class IV [Rhodobacter sp.]